MHSDNEMKVLDDILFLQIPHHIYHNLNYAAGMK